MFQLHWVCSCSQCVYFHGLHFSGSRLLCRELSDVGPGLHALPRSKPLRFRFLGTTQRHSRLGLRVVPFPGPSSSGDQVLGERSHPPGVGFILSLPPSQLLGFLGIQWAHLLRCAVCLFWGADPCLQHCRWIPTIQNPKKSWLAIKPACSLVEDASLGPRLPSSSSGCPCLPVLGGGRASLQPASSAQSFVL